MVGFDVAAKIKVLIQISRWYDILKNAYIHRVLTSYSLLMSISICILVVLVPKIFTFTL